MLYKLFLTTFSMLTLATCNTKKELSEVETAAEATTVNTDSVSPVQTETTTTIPVKENSSEMSDVLPPDKESQADANQDVVNAKSGMVSLKEGENKFVKELGMNVTFKKIVEDSRCPKDVNCVWEGVATAEIEVMGLETRPMTLRISTLTQGEKYKKVQQFNGYNISLDQLTPETTSGKGMKQLQGSYKIVLKFNKSEASTATTR